MKQFARLGLVTVVFFGFALAAWADLAYPRWPWGGNTPKATDLRFQPPPPVRPKYPLVVEIDNGVTQAWLYIPTQLNPGQASGPNNPRQQANWTNLPTVIAGICLALAMVCGGVWIMRRKQAKLSPLRLALSLGVVSAVVACVASPFVWANAPPPVAFPPAGHAVKLPSSFTAADDVQVIPIVSGTTIKLVINETMLHRLKNGPTGVPSTPIFMPGAAPGAAPVPFPTGAPPTYGKSPPTGY